MDLVYSFSFWKSQLGSGSVRYRWCLVSLRNFIRLNRGKPSINILVFYLRTQIDPEKFLQSQKCIRKNKANDKEAKKKRLAD